MVRLWKSRRHNRPISAHSQEQVGDSHNSPTCRVREGERQRRSTQEKLKSGLTSLQLIAMGRGRPWRTGSRPALFEAVLQSGYAALEQLENCPQATTFRVWKIRIHTEKDFGRGIRPVGRPQPVRSPRIMVGLGAFFHFLRLLLCLATSCLCIPE